MKRRPPHPSLAALSALSAMLALALGGCGARALVPNESDRLREELAARTAERDAALARASELDTRLRQLATERADEVDPEVAEALPALAAVAVSGLSTARLTRDNQAELAVVLAPRDARGRFLQITGTVRLSAAALVPGDAPLAAGALTVGPKALRECFRSGLLGTHYTLELPVEWIGERPATALSVAGEFTDGLTGRAYPFAATVPVVRKAAVRTTDDAQSR